MNEFNFGNEGREKVKAFRASHLIGAFSHSPCRCQVAPKVTEHTMQDLAYSMYITTQVCK